MSYIPKWIGLCLLAGCISVAASDRAFAGDKPAILHLTNGSRLTGYENRVEAGQLFWLLEDGTEIAIPLSAVRRIEPVARTETPGTGKAPRSDEGAKNETAEDEPGAESKDEAATVAVDESPAGDDSPAREQAESGTNEGTVVPAAYEMQAPFSEQVHGVQTLLPPGGASMRRRESDDALDETDSYFTSAWNEIRASTSTVFGGIADWTEQIEIGGRTLSGNTQEDFVTAGATFSKTTPEYNSLLEFGGQWSQSDSERTSNRWWGNGTIDLNKKGNWLFFMTTKNEYDEFENLIWRGTLSAGPGYRIINEPDRRFVVRAGPAVTREMFRAPDNNRATADLLGEFELRLPMYERLLWEHKTTAIPSMEDFELIRIVTSSGLSLSLDEEARWHVKLGFRHEYNSQPNEDRLPSDYTTSLFLVYKRK